MNRNGHFAYRAAAAEGATHVGMLVLVYDAVAGDLLKASAAAQRNDVQGRCLASNHALLLIGHLESWIEREDSAVLAQSLRELYRTVRIRIMQSQAANDSTALAEVAQVFSQTRSAWQAKERMLLSANGTRRDQGSVLAEQTRSQSGFCALA